MAFSQNAAGQLNICQAVLFYCATACNRFWGCFWPIAGAKPVADIHWGERARACRAARNQNLFTKGRGNFISPSVHRCAMQDLLKCLLLLLLLCLRWQVFRLFHKNFGVCRRTPLFECVRRQRRRSPDFCRRRRDECCAGYPKTIL